MQASPKNAPIDLDRHHLLVALLEEHCARRTWRKQNAKVASDAAAPEDGRNDSKILRFSSSFTMQQLHAEDASIEDASAVPTSAEMASIATAIAGITFDTPEL